MGWAGQGVGGNGRERMMKWIEEVDLASAIKGGGIGEWYEGGRQSSSQLELIMGSNPSPKGTHEPPNYPH